MAAFFLLRDPDPDRRDHVGRAALSRLAAFEGVATEMHSAGSLTLVWAARAGTPLDRTSSGERHAWIVGDAIRDEAGARATASDLLATTRDGSWPDYDGFHVAITYDDGGAFTLGTDILGLAAVYHVAIGDVVMAASSTELLGLHPSFKGRLDPFGLAAVLATNGLVTGRTIFSGVRRLEAGHTLVVRQGRAPEEREHYVVPVTSDLYDAPLDLCAEALHGALQQACRRHVPAGVPHTHLLSGGLDSRLLAGVLRGEKRRLIAITRGSPGDIEYRCAHGVARHLGLEHHLVPHGEHRPETFATHVRWGGLVSSPGTGASGSGAAALRRFHPVTVTGYLGDAILGGSHVSWSDKKDTPSYGADWAWWRVANWGIPVGTLERLLRRDVFGDALAEVRQTFRSLFAAAGDTDHARNYRFGLRYRNRFGIGDILSSLAFGAWPRSPHIDRGVIGISGSIPPAVLGWKSLEKYVLQRFHLGLACLPLDRNSYDYRPLVPRASDWVEHAVGRRMRDVRRRLGRLSEDRYYFRTFDINGEHWRSIRRLVEPWRERAYTVFERDVFDELVPPPDVDMPALVGIPDVSGRKALLAFLVMQPLIADR